MICEKCGAEYVLKGDMPTIDEIKQRLGDDADKLDINTENDTIVIRPKTWLQNEWYRINEAIKSMGGRWISEGQNSRWEI